MADTPRTRTQAKFLTGNLFRHVTVMSLTASVGLVAVFLVDFIDMVFISWLGEPALAAAVGFAGSILFFTISLGIGMAIAVGAMVARAAGSGDAAEFRRRTTNGMLYSLIFGLICAVLVWLSLDALTALVGATGETQRLAVGYLSIIVPSMPLMILGMVGGAVLRAHGDARRAMVVTLAGSAVNAALDPVLIFGLGLELTGAALASVAARVTMAAVAVHAIHRHHGGFERPSAASFGADYRAVASLALPATMTQLATPVGSAYVVRAMSEYGEGAVAGMAIVTRMTPLAFGVIFALSGAIGPIVGQNAGAGAFDRVRRTWRDGIVFCAIYTIAVSGLLFLLRAPIADLFGAGAEARALIYLFCGPLALLWFFNGVIFVSNAAFNNLDHAFWSTGVNWGRHTAGTIPFVILGAAWAGAPGVLIGQAVGGVIFAGLAWLLTGVVMARQDRPPPPPPFQRRARLLQLFHHRR